MRIAIPYDNGDVFQHFGQTKQFKLYDTEGGKVQNTVTLAYERDGKLCVNLKCDPFEADFLRQAYADVTPAYHMNKVHWNTVIVNGNVPEEELQRMIEKSHALTAPKARYHP